MTPFSKFANQVLELLTWRLRVVAEEQLHWLADNTDFAMKRLVVAGFLASGQLTVPLFDLARPIFDSSVQLSAPNFGQLAWKLRKRHQQAQPSTTSVFWATDKAVRLFGGAGGRLRQPFQVTHDLGMASVYFARDATTCDEREQGCCWLGEDVVRTLGLLRPGSKVPDALIVRSTSTIAKVIEFGGQYSRARLRQIHAHWSCQRIPYELW